MRSLFRADLLIAGYYGWLVSPIGVADRGRCGGVKISTAKGDTVRTLIV